MDLDFFFSRDFNLDIESNARTLPIVEEKHLDHKHKMTLQHLPVEILSKIASYLKMKEVKSLLFMCKSLNGIALYDHPDFQELTFPSNYLAGWHLFCFKYVDHRYDLILTRRLFKLIAEDVKVFIENSLVGYRPRITRSLFPPKLYINKLLSMPESLASECYHLLKMPYQIIQQKIFNESESLRNTFSNISSLRSSSPTHPFPSHRLPSSLRERFHGSCESVRKLIEICLDVHVVYLMGKSGGGMSSGARAAKIISELDSHDADSRLRRHEILMRCDRYNSSGPLTSCQCKKSSPPFKESKRLVYALNYLQGEEIFCMDF